MKIKGIVKNMTPLLFLNNGDLLCYKYGSFYICKSNGTLVKEKAIFCNVQERVLSRCKLLARFLRLGVRSAILYNNSIVIFSLGHIIYEYNLSSKIISSGYYFKDRIRPLKFTLISGLAGFDDGIYFGGYLSNPIKGPVHIYKRFGEDGWKIVYTFQKGEINHIHNVVPDSYRNCVWIFTGDFGEAATIWKATDNFKSVVRIFNGNQQYRACAAYALPEGILYATDTPFDLNYIYLLKHSENGYSLAKITPIPGSCIYSCQWKEYFVFSTTVESDGLENNILRFLLSRKRGKGIQDDYIHLFVGNLNQPFLDVLKIKKDYFPFSFQFGAFVFPSGVNSSDNLFLQPIASSKFDKDLVILS